MDAPIITYVPPKEGQKIYDLIRGISNSGLFHGCGIVRKFIQKRYKPPWNKCLRQL